MMADSGGMTIKGTLVNAMCDAMGVEEGCILTGPFM